MPLITVSMYPGRTQQQKNDFAKSITKSAVEVLKTKEEHVFVDLVMAFAKSFFCC
jgi:4-oxalocrotonate tautomerase